MDSDPARNAVVPDARPELVMLCNAQTPYRLALHLRILREIPAMRLVSIFTHEVSNSPWVIDSPGEIGPICFGQGESSETSLRHGLAEWRKGGKIIAHLRSLRAPVVVIHGYNDLGRLRVLRWCHSNGVPVFLWGDSNARSEQNRWFLKRIKSRYVHYVVNRTLGTMVCGSLGRDFFLKYGADPSKIFLVPYEPDYAQIESLSPTVIQEAAKKYGLSPGRRRIIYSGRLVPQKRVDLVLRAFASIAKDRPDWDLVIAGDGVERQKLQALVPEQLRTRVKWLGFVPDQSIVSALYRNADVLCIPSEYEPWALVVNEAAAAGLAIVSSSVVGAAAELVRDDVNGKVFENKDLESLTCALRHVMAPENVDRLKSGSRGVLKDWRLRGDPIAGLKKALLSV